MSNRVMVDLFVEDRAHEEFLKPLLARVAEEEGFETSLQFRSAQGGVARAMQEFRAYQRLLGRGLPSGRHPDLLIVAMDGNCSTFNAKRSAIQQETKENVRHMLVSACPNPHIERWFLVDPGSFHNVVGYRPDVASEKCERGYYKRLLSNAVKEGGHIPTLGGIEFARDIVEKMDLYRASKNDASFKAFLDDLRDGLKSLHRSNRRKK